MKKLLSYLPMFIQKRLIYRSIHINYHLDDNVVFKVAETKDEIIQALTLLQQAYKDEKLTSDNDEVRATIYHALPTTTIIIAKINNEVVATLSHIEDGPLGLPLEKVFDLSLLRNQGKKICEIGSLAIKKELRNSKNNLSLYFHLMAFGYKFSKDIVKDDCLCLASHPRAAAFYQAIGPFRYISKEIKDYNFVGSSPAFAQYLEHEEVERLLEHRFEFGEKLNKTFQLFFCEPTRNYHFPSPDSYCFPHKVLSPEELNELFFIKSTTLNKLDKKDRTTISNVYHLKSYKASIDQLDCSDMISRNNPRFNLTLYGHFDEHNNKVRVTDISRDGLQLIFSGNFHLRKGAYIKIELKLENYDSITIEGNIIWNLDNKAGISIRYINPEDQIKWNNLLDSIGHKFNSAA